MVPHPTGQSKVRPIRTSTPTYLKPIPQHGHKGLEEERTLQPTRVHHTTTAGCLQRPFTTSQGTKSHRNEFTLTTHHSQPAGVHLQLVHTFRLSHGPKTQGPISHSPDEVARDTCRGSSDRESPLKAYIQSPDFTEHLKEWWDAITPSLYNHFLCRNPNCKSVILNSHWLRTMDRQQLPFSGISHNRNIGELVPAKQCLVIKVPAQHSANAPIVGGQQLASTDTEHTYHCFLTQWPETDTQYLLNTMKQITADLLEGWIQAEDKVLFLHSKLMAHLQKTQLLPYMKREAWTQNNITEIRNRNTQAGSDKYKLDLLPPGMPGRAPTSTTMTASPMCVRPKLQFLSPVKSQI